jgi:hypothetical protein
MLNKILIPNGYYLLPKGTIIKKSDKFYVSSINDFVLTCDAGSRVGYKNKFNYIRKRKIIAEHSLIINFSNKTNLLKFKQLINKLKKDIDELKLIQFDKLWLKLFN